MMTAILYGLFGALLALALLGGGFFLGWRAKTALIEKTRQTAAEHVTEQQKKQLEAENKAFSRMLNYNMDAAYGLDEDTTKMLTQKE
jgi:hypothetical protein